MGWDVLGRSKGCSSFTCLNTMLYGLVKLGSEDFDAWMLNRVWTVPGARGGQRSATVGSGLQPAEIYGVAQSPGCPQWTAKRHRGLKGFSCRIYGVGPGKRSAPGITGTRAPR